MFVYNNDFKTNNLVCQTDFINSCSRFMKKKKTGIFTAFPKSIPNLVLDEFYLYCEYYICVTVVCFCSGQRL